MKSATSRAQYAGFWSGFEPEQWLLHQFFLRRAPVTVIGPFGRSRSGYKADFFVTGENKPPRFDLARKQIGFWRSYKTHPDVFRSPDWTWWLDWPGIDYQPPYDRYGMRLSIDRLMRPISDTYGDIQSRQHRAVIFTTHLRQPRARLYKLVNGVMGCDGHGRAFCVGDKTKPKKPVLEQYAFALCPENSIGDGYITEKIPDAFHAGCIPITWCRPEDLSEDFNPEAVVNLYGLDDKEIGSILHELLNDTDFIEKKRRVPLLKRRPTIDPLIEFICG